MIHPFTLKVTDCSKSFNGAKPLFPPCSFSISNGQVLGITGWNGSGKSTLIKMIAGVLKPSAGSIQLFSNNIIYNYGEFSSQIGLVSPYLHLYEEFTPLEHAELFCNLSHIAYDEKYALELLHCLGLMTKKHEIIRTFSSGMKQRVKYMLAYLRKPIILLLDEPTTNIDVHGIEAVQQLISMHKNQGGGTIIATNEQSETEICSSIINLQSL